MSVLGPRVASPAEEAIVYPVAITARGMKATPAVTTGGHGAGPVAAIAGPAQGPEVSGWREREDGTVGEGKARVLPARRDAAGAFECLAERPELFADRQLEERSRGAGVVDGGAEALERGRRAFLVTGA